MGGSSLCTMRGDRCERYCCDLRKDTRFTSEQHLSTTLYCRKARITTNNYYYSRTDVEGSSLCTRCKEIIIIKIHQLTETSYCSRERS